MYQRGFISYNDYVHYFLINHIFFLVTWCKEFFVLIVINKLLNDTYIRVQNYLYYRIVLEEFFFGRI